MSRHIRPRLILNTLLCLLACSWGVNSNVVPGAGASPVTSVEDEVTLTITNDGFAPSQITRPLGRFMLSVDNRSDTSGLTLRLIGEGGTLVREFKVPANTLDWSAEVELSVGHYTLTEADHSAWNCQISIQ